jgi:zinc protease
MQDRNWQRLRAALWRMLLTAALAPTLALAAPPAIQKETLENGLDVLVVESHAAPLVTVEIAARNGSMTEPPEWSGLSHLYEHMFFKANAVIPTQEAWLARAQELGLVWNGTTNTERVNYFFTTTSDQLEPTMVFMRDAIVSPRFDPKELERERVVVTGEMDRNEGNPFYFWFKATTARAFWKHPSRKDPLGSRATVLATTVEQMQLIQARYYVPNNSVLIVTGDVSAPAVFALARKLYAGWKRAADPFVQHPLVQHPPIPYSNVVVVEQPVRAVAGQFLWHGPSTVGKDVELTYAADLLTLALSEPSSRFQRTLVDGGACLAVNLVWTTQMNVGPISASFQAMPDKTDACAKAVLAELPKLKEPGYFSDEELKAAAYRAELDQMQQREKPSELAHSLSFWWTSAGLDYYLGYVDHLRQVGRESIGRYLDDYVLGRPFVFGVLVSAQMVKEQHLDAGHFEQLLGARPWVQPGEPALKAQAGKGKAKAAKAQVRIGGVER